MITPELIETTTSTNLEERMASIKSHPFLWQCYIFRCLLIADPVIREHPCFAEWAKQKKDQILHLPLSHNFSIPPAES